MSSVRIEKVNSTHIRVHCEPHVAAEIHDRYTFMVPGAKYMPAYKNRMWDGKIRLFNTYNHLIYSGLLLDMMKFLESSGYAYSVDKSPRIHQRILPDGEVTDFIKSLDLHARGEPIEPYDFQQTAIEAACKIGRCLLLSPTGSGKSLIIYTLVRALEQKIEEDKKILIIVPTTGLIEQMSSDFADYSSEDPNWDAEGTIHKIYSGQSKVTNAKVVVATWQSLFRLPKSFFNQFGAVIGDECHQFKAKSLTSIMEKLENCDFRIGTTGTLDGTTTHKMVLEGLFGPVLRVAETKTLMEDGVLTPLQIQGIVLKYPDEIRKTQSKLNYQDEISYLFTLPERNRFIGELCKKLSGKGNTLVLFTRIEEHGKPLYEMMQKMLPGRSVFYVSGETPADEREAIRLQMEKEDDAVLIASSGTFSTGINIRNLHNIVFAAPSKSRVRVLQSIGRQLRKSNNKVKATLYDIADDLSWKSKKNTTLKHFLERVELYNQERFDYKIHTIEIDVSSGAVV